MSGNYNHCCFIGNLTRDVEVRYTGSQTTVANTAIAVNTKMGDKTETLFIDIIAFGKIAEVMKQYVNKGSSVMVDGRLRLNQWTAQDGTKRSRMELLVNNFQILQYIEKEPQPGDRQYYENNNDIPEF